VNWKVLLLGAALSLPLIGLLLRGLGRDPSRIDSPLVGKTAPGFELTPVGGGERLSLEALRGRVVVMNFWATWCGPCYQEHPVLTEAARQRTDVTFLGIVYEDEEDSVKAYLAKQGSAFPSLMDAGGKAAIAYGVFGVPETFFITPEGVIADKFVGPLTPTALASRLEKARGIHP
jgi:cytochrome c biogenesis protein CcmG/thiol:disulfide interchange protein DsbE